MVRASTPWTAAALVFASIDLFSLLVMYLNHPVLSMVQINSNWLLLEAYKYFCQL
jgi:hypothetical protein